MLKSAVFLDRDGTLIEEVGYLKNPEDLKLIKGTVEAVRKLNNNKIPAILLTNQSGVARGYFDEENVKKLNNLLNDILKAEGAWLDGAYYCPHHPEGKISRYTIACECRKPKSGLINLAMKDFKDIDPLKSFVIGDKASDVELAKNAGCRGVLLKTGYGSQVLEGSYQEFVKPDYIAEDILDAVNWILNEIK